MRHQTTKDTSFGFLSVTLAIISFGSKSCVTTIARLNFFVFFRIFGYQSWFPWFLSSSRACYTEEPRNRWDRHFIAASFRPHRIDSSFSEASMDGNLQLAVFHTNSVAIGPYCKFVTFSTSSKSPNPLRLKSRYRGNTIE